MSLIAWQDTTPAEHQRAREIIALFAEPSTLDELGIGQVRDAFSNLLFPGTSTLHTRARYLLIIPWLFQREAAGGFSGSELSARVNRRERWLIEVLKREEGPTREAGIIGARSGAKVKNTPASLYWGALRSWQVLTRDRGINELGLGAGLAEADELTEIRTGDWWPTLPEPPSGFPMSMPGGLNLRREEASWLRDRLLASAPGTCLAELVRHRIVPDDEQYLPWEDPGVRDLDNPEVRSALEQAKAFSIAVHGAALLYNLMVAEEVAALRLAGHQVTIDSDSLVDDYVELLEQWDERDRPSLLDWDLDEFWALMRARVPQLSGSTVAFIKTWTAFAQSGAPLGAEQRSLIRLRERQKKGRLARLGNQEALTRWAGNSGSAALNYRWGTVKRMVTDIVEGLDAGA